MRVCDKGLQFAQPIIARTCLEGIAESERTQRRIAARAPPSDSQPIAIYQSTIDQIAGSIHTIVDINYAPLAFKPSAVLSTIAGAATIIHIEHRKSTAGPILGSQAEHIGASRCWPTVTVNEKRWALTGRSDVIT